MSDNPSQSGSIIGRFRDLLASVPYETKYILLLFIGTRLVLTGLGLLARRFFPQNVQPPMSSFSFLNVWGVWDSYHYVHIADSGYTSNAFYAFFPLYPLLMKALAYVIGNAFISGLIISNVCLLFASFYLYRLVLLEKESDTALESIKYLYLYPTAFVLSGVFTESLYLALIIAGFYYAKKQRWWIVGMLGLLLSATRTIGVFFLLPMVYEYAKSKEFKLQKIGLDAIPLLLIPVGLFCYMAYNYLMIGDPLGFGHVLTAEWGRQQLNPILSVVYGLLQAKVNALIALACIAFLTVFYRKIGFSYWLVGVYSIILPLFSGIGSMHRYSLVAFPMYIILAELSKNKYVEQFAPILLALAQGALLVLWTCQIAVE
ncbi:MAG TPA: mannosyltransferase family protein [Methanocella sp.]|uniref:mannosyltransferase family protein n=1 Tax=Methanocella sp. TaxID=2052833 RepID=UPI002C413738|nr:mannosyltransferase family protein [Methanocella sp.]HTY91602.1 mannosyltransferase family protein [Methanocella sp.]